MEKKKEEIEKELLRIWKILVLAKECFYFSQYLHNPKTEKERNYINKSQELDFIRHILWRTAIIELSKLLNSSNSDRYNINRFILKFMKDGYYGGMGINHLKIEQWKAVIKSKENIIEIILGYRDKVYAHSDPSEDEYSMNDIDFKPVEDILIFIENIIEDIFSTVLKSAIDNEMFIFKKERFDLIEILVNEESRKNEELMKYLKNQ